MTEDGSERFVRYGETKEQLDQVAAARVGRYEREHLCDSPANDSIGWRDPGFIHDAVMKNLPKGARVYYQVISSYNPNSSVVFNFLGIGIAITSGFYSALQPMRNYDSFMYKNCCWLKN